MIMDTPEKNITRAIEALSPYINNPRKTVIKIEACVGLAAALFFLQFILGGWRRRSGHWFIQSSLWLCYTASFPLITYTIGLMASSPIKNGLYPLWAILLFWAAGCTNSVTAYALEDNKQWKRYFFELFQYYIYSEFMVGLLDGTIGQKTVVPPVGNTLLSLVIVLFYINIVRVTAGWLVTNSSSTRVVADYMQTTDLRGDQGTLDGGRYLVRFYDVHDIAKVPTYITELSIDDIVTVNMIWEASREFGYSENGGGLPWKDVCLSFALSELLKRRFYGMECAEANLPETRDFVLKGLLKHDDNDKANKDYTRAFQIIEVELGFLYDFFFTKYAVLADFGIIIVLYMVTLKLILISICGAFLFRGSMTIKTSKPVIEVGTTSIDVTITVVIIGAICLVEVLQVILYVASDWTAVSLACSYTRLGTSCGGSSVVLFLRRFDLSRTKFGKFLDRRLNLFGYWQNKMGQSSVIKGCLHFNFQSLQLIYDATHFINAVLSRKTLMAILMDTWLSVRYSRATFLMVPDLVKREIVFVLEEHCKRGGPLTNGVAALNRNGNFGEFAQILSQQNNQYSQTRVMLIWHIAIEYCNIASSNEEPDQRIEPHRYVATTLSRYCAYLMSFLPDLLPGNSTDTKFVNEAVLMEANKLLRGREPITKEILLEAIRTNPTDDNNEGTDNIFIKGLKLGSALENKGVGRWKVLAEFWAETIIFIAPSDNAKAHMERLAQGGEFLTHIWALLNHAGILTREQDLPPQVVPQPQDPQP